MSIVSIVINTPHSSAHYAQPGQGVANLVRVAGLIKGLISGALGSAYVHTSVASVTATLVSVVAANTITIAGVTLTASAAPTDETQFLVGADDPSTAANLAAAINAHSTLKYLASGSAAAGVVTIASVVPGPVGNLIAVSRVGTPITLSAAALSGATTAPEKVR